MIVANARFWCIAHVIMQGRVEIGMPHFSVQVFDDKMLFFVVNSPLEFLQTQGMDFHLRLHFIDGQIDGFQAFRVMQIGKAVNVKFVELLVAVFFWNVILTFVGEERFELQLIGCEIEFNF